jgi:hypothetical protein
MYGRKRGALVTFSRVPVQHLRELMWTVVGKTCLEKGGAAAASYLDNGNNI